jgi:hypothetical protein
MTEIILKINIDALRDVYFKGKEPNVFFGPQTKKKALYLLVSLLTYPFFAFYTIGKDETLFVLGSVAFSLPLFGYYQAVKPIWTWKKSVDNFILESEKIKDLKFTYDENMLIHTSDNQLIKKTWDTIDKAIINADCIWLFSDVDIVLPKGAMNENEFNALAMIVTDQVKNVYKNQEFK